MEKQRIIPHLWFDTQAEEAAHYYAGVFPDSRVDQVIGIEGTPSGDVPVVYFTLWGHEFQAISAGPLFRFNPSLSFMVNFDPLFFGKGEAAAREARRRLDEAWEKLAQGGRALMPLGKYPFSERYGWIEDRFGLGWQLILGKPDGDPRPPILPSLLFTGDKRGQAKAAADHYAAAFPDTQRGMFVPYGPGMEPDKEGDTMFSDMRIGDTWFTLMDSARQQGAKFNEAVSFMIPCEDQAAIDRFTKKLSAVPEAEQCGWVKDKFGVSWQIVPAEMDGMLREGSKEQVARVTEAFLQMKKFDIAALRAAYDSVPAAR